jgi:hypothetical protein
MYAILEPFVVMILISFKALASHGDTYYTGLCKQEVLRLGIVDDTAPLGNAPYLVAYYRDDRVRMVGFSELEPAQGIYNVISSYYAKVLMDSKRSEVRCFSFPEVRV